MRIFVLTLALTIAASGQEQTHPSQVMGKPRTYRVYLPANYATSQKRYPVIYWMYGYEAGSDEREGHLTAWAAKHDAIIVGTGPVETSGNYPLYLPELAEQVDRTLRTIADRDHRAACGFGAGGFLALWQAAKAPDLIAGASAISPARSASIGQRGFETDTLLEDLRIDYESVRTRIFNSDSGLEAALDFHLSSFASPLAKPKVFAHADAYPNFSIWGWSVISNRRSPGVTLLENVSPAGFRSVVREWLPGGAPVSGVKLTITSPRLFPPGTTHSVTYVHLADRKLRRVTQRADAQGRLTFDLDGSEYEVGIGAGPVLALSRYELVEEPWATVGKPVNVRLTFWNKGAARSLTSVLTWESPTVGVKFAQPGGRLPALAPGESATVPLTFTAQSALGGRIKIMAAGLAIEVPVYPPLSPAANFQILDEGDRDGHASPGETFAISLPEGRAELITSDPCVDTSVRIVDGDARYTEATIPAACPPGRIVHILARTASGYSAVEFPIWYKLP